MGSDLQVANVLQCGMTNMRCLLDTYGSHVSNKDIMASSADFVPLLVEKTGDNSSRMQAIATEGIMYLAATPGMAAVLAPHVSYIYWGADNVLANTPLNIFDANFGVFRCASQPRIKLHGSQSWRVSICSRSSLSSLVFKLVLETVFLSMES